MNSFFDGQLKIEVATASGIEAVTKRELTRLGYEPSGANFGRITFDGTYTDVLRANVFLRTANRVRIVLDSFKVETFDELFDGISAIDWKSILPRDAKIVVDAKSKNSKIFALSATQSVAKKAIVNAMTSAYHCTLKECGEEYDIEISLLDDVATVTLDTSGDGLHKRGYRTYLGDAPIRETLAAAMIELSVWNPDRPLIDPFCGSGTIPIEAALIGLNIAPGMNRNFACEKFSFAPNVRNVVQDEAESLIDHDRTLKIIGFDINPEAIKLALKHANRAGVQDKIHFQAMNMRDVSSKLSHGVIITNPPYGERLMDEAELKVLYADFGKMTKGLDEWCVYVISSYKAFEKYYGKKAVKVRKLYNSELECNFYTYLGKAPEKVKK